MRNNTFTDDYNHYALVDLFNNYIVSVHSCISDALAAGAKEQAERRWLSHTILEENDNETTVLNGIQYHWFSEVPLHRTATPGSLIPNDHLAQLLASDQMRKLQTLLSAETLEVARLRNLIKIEGGTR